MTAPVPARLKLLRGNPGNQPIRPEPEPIQLASIPDPPDYLLPDAVTEWRRDAPELYRLGLLTLVDVNTLAAYCSAYARWLIAERSIKAIAAHDTKFSGLAARNDNGHIIANPIVGVAARASCEMVKYAMQLGMTPLARTRLAAGPVKKAGKFDGLVAS
jgi:P27 family predicted phage terminase small subunit